MSSIIDQKCEVFKTVIPADLGCVRETRKKYLDDYKSRGVIDKDLELLKLIFTEIVNNAVIHGCRGLSQPKISIAWSLFDEVAVLDVSDPGKGPCRELIDTPSLPEDPLASHGRGLFMIDEGVDEWEHWFGSCGYRTVLKKRIRLGDHADSFFDPEIDRVVEELSATYESLSAFYRLGENLISMTNIDSFVAQSLEELNTSERFDSVAFAFGEKMPQDYRDLFGDHKSISEYAFSDEIGQCLERGDPFVWDSTKDVSEIEVLRFFCSGACMPIRVDSVLWGVLVAGTSRGGRPLGTPEINNLSTFSDVLGIALSKSHLQSIRDAEQRTMREIELATEIQKGLLPICNERCGDGWILNIAQKSALEIAGDFGEAVYDPDGNLVISLIDVMGKSVSAALLASIYRVAFHIHVKQRMPLDEMFQSINRTLYEQLGELTMFVTGTVIRVSKNLRQFEEINAGHCPSIVLREDGTHDCIPASGPPLGLFSDIQYKSHVRTLRGDESLWLVTDGCYEWVQEGEEFGWDAFLDWLKDNRTADTQSVFQNLLDDIMKRSDRSIQRDDITLVSWRLNSRQKGIS